MSINQKPPFIKPCVPFSCVMEERLQDGMCITVCGRVLPNADRFNVNLQKGSDVIALHFNPRYNMLWFGPDYVVHNSFLKGAWGTEERKIETPFPKGQMFSLQINVTMDSYKIFANGKLFSEYKSRQQFLDVDRICVVGKVELSLVTIHSLEPHHAALSGSLTVPYKTIIYGGVKDGKGIILQGDISKQAKGVEICLRYKTGIALNFKLCFLEDMVVYNSFEDGKWGNQEKSKLKPIERGQSFQVIICSSPENYEIFFNGEKAHTYKHRFGKLDEIDVLDVSGDLQLSFVNP